MYIRYSFKSQTIFNTELKLNVYRQQSDRKTAADWEPRGTSWNHSATSVTWVSRYNGAQSITGKERGHSVPLPSPTPRTWAWASSRRRWWTGKSSCSRFGHKESDMTERLNWTELKHTISCLEKLLYYMLHMVLMKKVVKMLYET